jgi:hypothetical protein
MKYKVLVIEIYEKQETSNYSNTETIYSRIVDAVDVAEISEVVEEVQKQESVSLSARVQKDGGK